MTSLLLIFFISLAESASPLKEPIFNPLSTLPTRTLDPYKIAVQRSPGTNLGGSFLLSSLNIGLLPRLEIGTSPALYLFDEHNWNANLKLNFWRGEWIDWSLFFAHVNFDATFNTNEKAELRTSTTGFVVNVHLPNQRWILSGLINNTCSHIKSSNNLSLIYSFDCRSEIGADLQWSLNEDQWITIGTARLRDTGVSAYENLHGGYGIAWTQFLEEQFISRPSLGVYYVPATNDVLYLVTTTFFEKKSAVK